MWFLSNDFYFLTFGKRLFERHTHTADVKIIFKFTYQYTPEITKYHRNNDDSIKIISYDILVNLKFIYSLFSNYYKYDSFHKNIVL